MSYWTSVTGIINFASISPDQVSAVSSILRNSPKGSEDELHVEITTRPSKHQGLITLTAQVIHALRDYGDKENDVPDLVQWVKDVMDAGSFSYSDTVLIRIEYQDNQWILTERDTGDSLELAALGGQVSEIRGFHV